MSGPGRAAEEEGRGGGGIEEERKEAGGSPRAVGAYVHATMTRTAWQRVVGRLADRAREREGEGWMEPGTGPAPSHNPLLDWVADHIRERKERGVDIDVWNPEGRVHVFVDDAGREEHGGDPRAGRERRLRLSVVGRTEDEACGFTRALSWCAHDLGADEATVNLLWNAKSDPDTVVNTGMLARRSSPPDRRVAWTFLFPHGLSNTDRERIRTCVFRMLSNDSEVGVKSRGRIDVSFKVLLGKHTVNPQLPMPRAAAHVSTSMVVAFPVVRGVGMEERAEQMDTARAAASAIYRREQGGMFEIDAVAATTLPPSGKSWTQHVCRRCQRVHCTKATEGNRTCVMTQDVLIHLKGDATPEQRDSVEDCVARAEAAGTAHADQPEHAASKLADARKLALVTATANRRVRRLAMFKCTFPAAARWLVENVAFIEAVILPSKHGCTVCGGGHKAKRCRVASHHGLVADYDPDRRNRVARNGPPRLAPAPGRRAAEQEQPQEAADARPAEGAEAGHAVEDNAAAAQPAEPSRRRARRAAARARERERRQAAQPDQPAEQQHAADQDDADPPQAAEEKKAEDAADPGDSEDAELAPKPDAEQEEPAEQPAEQPPSPQHAGAVADGIAVYNMYANLDVEMDGGAEEEDGMEPDELPDEPEVEAPSDADTVEVDDENAAIADNSDGSASGNTGTSEAEEHDEWPSTDPDDDADEPDAQSEMELDCTERRHELGDVEEAEEEAAEASADDTESAPSHRPDPHGHGHDAGGSEHEDADSSVSIDTRAATPEQNTYDTEHASTDSSSRVCDEKYGNADDGDDDVELLEPHDEETTTTTTTSAAAELDGLDPRPELPARPPGATTPCPQPAATMLESTNKCSSPTTPRLARTPSKMAAHQNWAFLATDPAEAAELHDDGARASARAARRAARHASGAGAASPRVLSRSGSRSKRDRPRNAGAAEIENEEKDDRRPQKRTCDRTLSFEDMIAPAASRPPDVQMSPEDGVRTPPAEQAPAEAAPDHSMETAGEEATESEAAETEPRHTQGGVGRGTGP